jgi:carbon monoxide dehydrogenase subunit G
MRLKEPFGSYCFCVFTGKIQVEGIVMLVEEKFTVKIPLRKLFDFLLDVKAVGPCIPGCEKLEAISQNEYESIIKAKVGIFSVKFKIKSIITEIIPYKFIRTLAEGNEFTKLAHFKQKTEIKLKGLSENETEVAYKADVSIVGKLATFGNRILRPKAKALGREFAENVTKKLENM